MLTDVTFIVGHVRDVNLFQCTFLVTVICYLMYVLMVNFTVQCGILHVQVVAYNLSKCNVRLCNFIELMFAQTNTEVEAHMAMVAARSKFLRRKIQAVQETAQQNEVRTFFYMCMLHDQWLLTFDLVYVHKRGKSTGLWDTTAAVLVDLVGRSRKAESDASRHWPRRVPACSLLHLHRPN